jgi:hypothetical protein
LQPPIDNKVFFAGEACHPQWAASLTGAYLTGLQTAEIVNKYFYK